MSCEPPSGCPSGFQIGAEGRGAHNEPRLASQLQTIEVEELPPFDEIKHGQVYAVRLGSNTTDLTHGLHRFPAKFIPQIPRWALQQFGRQEGCVVVDPFMGSGTTLVEGLVDGGVTVGVDIDPLARLIAHAKTDLPSSARIAQLGDAIRRSWPGPATRLVPPMPDLVDFEHWFSCDAWSKLQSLHHTLGLLECSEEERRFLLALFSSILRWVSNADDQSQKTYVSGTNHKRPPEVLDTYWRGFERAVAGLRQLEAAKAPHSRVVISDAGDATSLGLAPRSVDLIVTSPPYVDSVDYMYNFMLEYFWLGPTLGIPDRRSFNRLRRRQIGAKSPERAPEVTPEIISDLIDERALSRHRRQAVVAYFVGMWHHFLEASRCMRTGARYVLVVGNSQTRTNILPVHDCLVRLAAASGLELEKAFAYRVRRHYMKFPRQGRGGIILIDWIVVLRRADRAAAIPERLPLPWVTLREDAVAN